jgi:hypothetical protein
MSSVRTPVGPQPAAVYWRRRLVVLLGLVAVVVIIVLIVVRPGTENAGQQTPSPQPTASNTPVVVDEGGACNPAVIQIEPVTDQSSYGADEEPQLSMSITNTGSVACVFEIPVDGQVFSIVSGSDPIWTSTDCLTTEATEVMLEPNTPLGSAPFGWDRTRSSPDTCDSSLPEVIAGGATYRLSVAVGDIESAGDVPFILN